MQNDTIKSKTVYVFELDWTGYLTERTVLSCVRHASCSDNALHTIAVEY